MNKCHQAEDDEHQRLIEKELKYFNNSFVEFNSRSFEYMKRQTPLRPGSSINTSDDAKDMERRPNKRDITLYTNLTPLSSNHIRYKRRCPSPALADDSTEAVPSIFKF
ncbi:hypothetical protein RhiirA5_431605 [Rhizophagus irregularis]|nr:hypothetical protein RhiirA5_431605 [Rhizophagus irregularis]PKY18235.1 hypothetical protein RhiirB3_522609 [Rhizophagus irregularis]